MYTFDIYKEGIQYLGITDPDSIDDILNARYKNLIYFHELKTREINKYSIPQGLSKGKLKELLKETQEKIYEIKEKRRQLNNEITNYLYDEILENWINKKTKINESIKWSGKTGTQFDIKKAKAYPIEHLLQFNSSGFIKCLWHDEKSGSLHLDKKRNKVHCFAGCGDFDSIDVYQKINNITIGEAIKRLCQIQ